MRVIGGKLRGLKLAEVGEGDSSAHLRPTTDRVRESVFNLLINGVHGNPIPGARVLDLFAGTGALGIEAYSRGAAQVCFVDNGAKSRNLLQDNLRRARLGEDGVFLRRDALKLGRNGESPYGLVFLDPPYGKALGEPAIFSAIEGGWMAPGTVIVWEDIEPPKINKQFHILNQKMYGKSTITVMKYVNLFDTKM